MTFFRGFLQPLALITVLEDEFPAVKIAHNPCCYWQLREDGLPCGINELI
jgi:hypothetical protein